jgi:hypothetical protein
MVLRLDAKPAARWEVGQVLSEVQTEIHTGGKVLLGAAMDGVPIETGFRRKRQLATPVTRVKKLELTIQDPDAVSEQILKDSIQLYRQIQHDVPKIAAQIPRGRRIQREPAAC